MYEKHRRLLSLILCGVVTAGNIAPAFANSLVTLSIPIDDTPNLASIQVPAIIPLEMDTDGNISVSEDLEIINLNTDNKIELKALQVNGLNNWEIKSWENSNELRGLDINTKQLAMSFNSDGTLDGGSVDLTPGNWEIEADSSLELDVQARSPKQTSSNSGEVANVVYTFETVEEALICEKCLNEIEFNGQHELDCGHYECTDTGLDHNEADCGLNNHYNCDDLDHEECRYCGEFSCEGSHGLGVCDSTELSINYTNGLMLPGSENVAIVRHNYASEDYIESVESSDEGIATANVISSLSGDETEENVIISGVSRGRATITVSMHSGASKQFTVDISELDENEPIESEITEPQEYNDSLTSDTLVSQVLDNTEVSIPVLDSDGNNSETTITVTDDIIESVEDVELLPGDNFIDVVININNINITITINVFISAPLEGIQLDKDNIALNLNDHTEEQLAVTFMPSYTTDDKTITWSSDNASIATVDDTGLVRAVDSGSAVITATSADGAYSDTCNVTVEDSNSITIICEDTEGVEILGDKSIKTNEGSTISLPELEVADNYLFEKWINTETLETVTSETIFNEDSTIKPVIHQMFETDGNGSLLGYSTYCRSSGSQLEDLDIPSELYGETIIEIADNAFTNEVKTTSLSIPNTVTRIGNKSFQGLYKLNSLSLSDNLITLGDYALAGCFNLEEISLPNTLETVGAGAFKRTGISTIALTDNITSIGDYAFESCRNLSDIDFGNAETTLGNNVFMYCISLTELNIGDSVKSIGASATSGCNNIEKITLGDGVESIGTNAFAQLPKLHTVVLGKNLKTIDNYAFQANNALVNIDFNGAQAIGYGMFSNNQKIASLNIPGTVKNIGDDAFSGCESLTSVSIGTGVEVIGAGAFEQCINISSINIPNTVTTLGHYAFDDLYKVENIYVPSSVTSFGNNPFSGILNVTYEDTSIINSNGARAVNKIPVNGFIYSDDGKTLIGCVASKSGSVAIPSGVTRIEEYAFAGCDKVTSISMPNTVTLLGQCAFINCSSAKSINLSTGLTELRGWMFEGCKSLQSITIPSGITKISNNDFKDCESLNTVNHNKTITIISDYAFENCKSLESIDLTNVVTIDRSAFRYCENLKTVTFSNTLKTIESGAFRDCYRLWGVTVPSSVTTLGSSCFYDVPYIKYSGSLDTSNIGCNAVNGYVSSNVVYDSSSKTKLLACHPDVSGVFNVPNSVTEIGSGAFQRCDKLTGINIPDSVKTIGDCTFTYCTNLEYINFPSDFSYAAYWSVVYIDNMREVDFSGVTDWKSMHYFARNCASLEKITMSDTMTKLNWHSFRENPKLSTLILSDSITSIGSNIIWDTPSLKTLTLPSKLESMDYGALGGSGLTEITLPSALETMKGNIFRGSTYLEVIYVEGKSSESDFDNANADWNDSIAVVYLGDD